MCQCTCKEEASLDKQTVEELVTRLQSLRTAARENANTRREIASAINKKLAPAGLWAASVPAPWGRPT